MSAATVRTQAGSATLAPLPPNKAGAVRTIAAKELAELLRDARLLWAGGLIALLMLAALLLGWQQKQAGDAERASARNETYAQWLDQGNRNPHSAAHFGQYAFKPASALSFIDPGINPFVGVTVWMEAHKQNEFKYRPARDATALRRFGDLSMAFVWQVLTPLLIILLAFSAFSGERERGTLRQLLSVGVRPLQLLAGKWLAISVVVAVLLLPPLALGAVAAVLGDESQAGDALARTLLMGAGYAVYLLGFCALALGVSAACASSRKALIVLLAFWVGNSFIAPRVMTDLAARVAPTPSAVVFQKTLADARKATFGHDESHPAFVAFRERIFKQYGVTRIEDMPVNFKALALRFDDEAGYRIYDENYPKLWAIYAAQSRLRALAGIVFPLAAMQPWSMALAGTDTAQQNHFAAAAEIYRRGIQTAMSEDMIRNRPNTEDDYLAGPGLWDHIKPFEYRTAGVGWVLTRRLPELLILLAWAGLAAAFALRAARRLKPV